MLPEAYVTHMTAGRLRIKIPSKKGERSYFLSLKDQFSGLPGVQKIEVNPLTGSVLVRHTLSVRESDLKVLSGYTEAGGLFKLGAQDGLEKPVSDQIGGIFKGADEKVRGFTGGQVDLSTAAVVGLLGVGLFQIARGKSAAPAWHVAFWYALNIFLNNQRGKTALIHKEEVSQ
jgi:hypothetical protein